MTSSNTKFSDKGVWKLFGRDALQCFIGHRNTPDLKSISDDDYIPTIGNLTFEVEPGKILVVIGFWVFSLGRVLKWSKSLQRCFEMTSRIQI